MAVGKWRPSLQRLSVSRRVGLWALVEVANLGLMTRKAASVRTLVGLEIHVQLATDSKMFTAAKNGFGGEPNTQVDPMVMGLPGTLPVMNKKAVEYSIMTGIALGCEIAPRCKWDRKSYYYPDLPKNYQISQYDQPLCGEGTYDLLLPDGSTKTIRIRRAHLEEDAGKLMHDAPGGYAIDYSIVDLNRAGTPLLEIVTEPDFDTPETVGAFARDLQRLVQYLGVSDGQMQMGQMRFEPNINVHITDEAGTVHKTAITEVKNLNSFSVVEKSVAYEVKRQVAEWEATGDLGKKATYGWDDAKQQTVLQREKEEAHDYRYFPDPDLMPVEVSRGLAHGAERPNRRAAGGAAEAVPRGAGSQRPGRGRPESAQADRRPLRRCRRSRCRAQASGGAGRDASRDRQRAERRLRRGDAARRTRGRSGTVRAGRRRSRRARKRVERCSKRCWIRINLPRPRQRRSGSSSRPTPVPSMMP